MFDFGVHTESQTEFFLFESQFVSLLDLNVHKQMIAVKL